jgi:hypothetical protein
VSGALIAAIMADRPVATITRTVYVENGATTVQTGETWAVAHVVGRGGTPSIGATLGLRVGGGGSGATLVAVTAGQAVVFSVNSLSADIGVDGTTVISAGNGSNTPNGADGVITIGAGVAYAPPVTRYGSGGIDDPLNPSAPDDAGQEGIGGGGIVVSREVTPSNFVTGVVRGGDPDALVTFYTADPR